MIDYKTEKVLTFTKCNGSYVLLLPKTIKVCENLREFDKFIDEYFNS